MLTTRQTGDYSASHKNPAAIRLLLGQRIRERRKHLRMNQSTLGQLLGVSYQQIQKYEHGLSEISVEKLLRFATALETAPEYFYADTAIPAGHRPSALNSIIPAHFQEPLRILVIATNTDDTIRFMHAVRHCEEAVDVHVIQNVYSNDTVPQSHWLYSDQINPDIIVMDDDRTECASSHFLKVLKRNPRFVATPIIVLTHSNSRDDMDAAYRLGAAGFIRKNNASEQYGEAIRSTVHYWANVVALPRL